MTQSGKILLALPLFLVVSICGLSILAGLLCTFAVQPDNEPVDPDLEGVMVTAGSVEVVIPRTRKPNGVFVSPTGHWLVFATDKTDNWFVLDIQTGQEKPLDFDPYSDIRWLNKEEFAAGYRVVNARDLSIREIYSYSNHDNDITRLEILRGAKLVYLLPERGTGGVDIVSGDPAYDYGFDAFGINDEHRPKGMGVTDYTHQILKERFPETEFVEVEIGYFQPTPGYRGQYPERDNTRYYVNYDFPSPDGRFYAKAINEPGPSIGRGIEIYQCGHKLVSHTTKEDWVMSPRGWAYDNSGFYFLLRPRSGWFSAGEQPVSILKLNLPPEVLAEAPPYEGEGFCE